MPMIRLASMSEGLDARFQIPVGSYLGSGSAGGLSQASARR